MKPSIRISIAYVLGSLITKHKYSEVLAHTEEIQLKISGRITLDGIDAEELETGYKYYGMHQAGKGTFHHSLENTSITFKTEGSNFSGMDSQSSKSFNGSVTGNSVKLFDYDEGKYFKYDLIP